MFQTEPILWLQSMRSDILTLLMRGASMIVDDTVFLVLGLILFFYVDHRKAYVVLVTLLWVALLTAVLKTWFALPRPSDVDMRVLLLETGEPNGTPFLAHGAASFLGLPLADVVNYVRALPSTDFGMPSGHCSSTVAFWGTVALLFRRKWTVILAAILAVVMPVSRMYLGRHFAGDTIAGLLIGGLALVCVVVLKRVIDAHSPVSTASLSARRVVIFQIAGLIVLPMLLLLSQVTQVYAATLFAFGLVYFATGALGIYDYTTTPLSRILTTLGALTLMAGLILGLKGFLPKSLLYGFVIVCVFGFTALGVGFVRSRGRHKQNAQPPNTPARYKE